MRTPDAPRRLAPAIALAVLAACGATGEPAAAPDLGGAAPPVGGIWAGRVTVEASAAGLRVGNDTERPIGYATFARDILPVINWRPCTDHPRCPTIAPGERRTIGPADIVGLPEGKGEVVFHWWHLVPGRDGRLEPDSVRAVERRF